jgi:hypothetical protein
MGSVTQASEVRGTVVSGSRTELQATLLMRDVDSPPPAGWIADEPTWSRW